MKFPLGYTAITPEIKKMILDILSMGHTKSGLANDLNIGYRARTVTIDKILGEHEMSYKSIREDVVEKIRAKHQLLKR